ncbi:dinitrogenase iron-molybdenum cofactor biosynthesis protein [Thermoplasmatales archaeon SG8-52-1]|nr:MAG: dinitrogenase iron-molybdenum cofactor biosynthesis protein [Thermoplasmatales archaeon SG8-52-1]
MKIVISSTGEDLNAQVDPRFGRCRYFLIIDIETMKYESISNESSTSSGGAGIQAAQIVARTGAEVVLTGNMGPNAFQTLSAAEIKVFTGANGTIKDVIEKYKKGELKKIESATVERHFGMKVIGKGFGRG